MKTILKKFTYGGFFIVLSVGILFPLIKPFLISGRAWTYDVDYHAFRMSAFHELVREGQIPPRWSSQLVYGWGSPIFSFNWSLPYWMSEPFLFAGWTITDSSKAVVILSIVLSYVFMYWLLREWFDFWPSLGGATVYEWALFRLYLLFTGGGLGMEVAFIFWPLLFWGVLRYKKDYLSSFLLITIGTAGGMLSHQVMFLMIMPLFWVFTVITLGKKFRQSLASIIVPFLTGLGLTTYFWLPAFLEQQYLHMGITESLFHNNFLGLITIFHQPGITNTQSPLQYWYWSTGWNLFAIGIVSFVLLYRTRNKFTSVKLFAVFFIIGQFLMTRVSSFLWSTVPLLSNFIYPVRFQALTLFCGAILSAFIISRMHRNVMWLGFVVVSVVTIGLNTLAIPTNWPRAQVSDAYYRQSDSTMDMMGEYLPVTATISYFFDDQDRFVRKPAARIVEGFGVIESIVKKQDTISFAVKVTAPVTVVINQLYFPGWYVYVNNKELPIQIYGKGEMSITLPAGDSAVVARFTDTPIRTFSNTISFITLIAMLFSMGHSLWKKRRFVN